MIERAFWAPPPLTRLICVEGRRGRSVYEVAARALKGAQRLRDARTAAKKRARQVSSPQPSSYTIVARISTRPTLAQCLSMCDACAPRIRRVTKRSRLLRMCNRNTRLRIGDAFIRPPSFFVLHYAFMQNWHAPNCRFLAVACSAERGATCLTAAYAPPLFIRPVFFAAYASSRPRWRRVYANTAAFGVPPLPCLG